MTFSMTFTTPETLGYLTDEVSDESPDEPSSALLDGCDQLDEAGCRFDVEGFGLRWYTEVGYDLGVAIVAFPEVIAALQEPAPARIDFASQGLDRRLDLVPATNGSTTITISPLHQLADFEADPLDETVDTAKLLDTLITICRQVAEAIVVVNPTLGALAPFPAWRSGRIDPVRQRT